MGAALVAVLAEITVAKPILLSFDDGPDIAFADGPEQGRAVERNEVARSFRLRYDLVRAQALSPEASMGLIESMIKEHN